MQLVVVAWLVAAGCGFCSAWLTVQPCGVLSLTCTYTMTLRSLSTVLPSPHAEHCGMLLQRAVAGTLTRYVAAPVTVQHLSCGPETLHKHWHSCPPCLCFPMHVCLCDQYVKPQAAFPGSSACIVNWLVSPCHFLTDALLGGMVCTETASCDGGGWQVPQHGW